MRTQAAARAGWRYLCALTIGGGAAALGSAAPAAAQGGERITGRVVDVTDQARVPAASVVVTGTNVGALTSDSGTFALQLPSGAKSLTVRRIGFIQRVVPLVAGQAEYSVALTKDVLRLEEQVVTGVATSVSSRNAANDVAVVSEEKIAEVPAPTIENALQGQVPGAQIQQENGGAPGGGLQVQIRGTTSIYANASPLYVVDGVIINNETVNNGASAITASFGSNIAPNNNDTSPNRIADLNPDDIANVEVLKGASASAIYGSKASSGVIIITTKRGAAGKPHWELSQSVGHFIDAHQMAIRSFPTLASATSWASAHGFSPATVAAQYAGPQSYQDQLFSNPQLSDETDLSVSGTQGGTQYFVSALTKYDNGIMTNTGYNKQSIRTNVTQQFNSRLSASANVFYAHDQTRRGITGNDNNGSSPYDFFSYTPQFLHLDHPNADGVWPKDPYGPANAFADAVEIQTPETINRFIGGGNISWTPITTAHQSLQLRLIGGADETQENIRLYAPPDLQLEQTQALPGISTVQTASNQYINYSINLIHHIGLSFLDATTSVGFVRERRDLSNPVTISQNLVAGANSPASGTVQSNYYTQTAQRDQSLYAQEQVLALDERLALTAGITAERSTNDGNINKFYFYPRYAASFRVPGFAFVDEIKLRAAYGQSGTQPLYGVRYTPLTVTLAGGRPGLVDSSTVGDARVQPEAETEIETGFDASLFHSRAAFNATIYQKRVSNLLLQAGVAPSVGYLIQWLNGGEFTNQGVELSLGVTPIQSNHGLTWVSTTTFYRNYSVVNSLPVGPFQTGGLGGPWGDTYMQVGRSVTQIVNPADVGANGLPIQGGEVSPTYVMDFSNGLSWAGFALSGVIEWSRGGNVNNYTATEFDFGPSLLADSALSAKRFAGLLTGLGLPYQETATYLKVRNISLTYTLPARFTRSALQGYVTSAKLAVTGRNLFGWYKYTGLDPEVSFAGSQNVARGFDVTPFPPARSFFFSLVLGL